MAGPQIGAGSRIPIPLTDLQQYNPNRADQVEGIWQPFYHKQTYLAAGQASLVFFNVAFAGDYTVTNMPNAAFFPAPTAFLCRAIMLNFIPGNPTATSAAAPTAAQTNNASDVIAVANAGYLEFVIGGKVYLRDSPSGRFAPNYGVSGLAALAGTLTAPALSNVVYARSGSRYYGDFGERYGHCDHGRFLLPAEPVRHCVPQSGVSTCVRARFIGRLPLSCHAQHSAVLPGSVKNPGPCFRHAA